jgi:hypothetical protein
MAVYVWSKEEKIRNEVLAAYKDIYFNEQQKPETTALGLIMLIKDTTIAEANSISKMVESIGIPKAARDEIWKYALGRSGRDLPDELRAGAISIISMLAKVKIRIVMISSKFNFVKRKLYLDQLAGFISKICIKYLAGECSIVPFSLFIVFGFEAQIYIIFCS